jgi:DNA-binding beta-propeller fold protein YncE
VKRVVLVNFILILIIIVASVFSYFYFVKRDITEVVHNLLPTVTVENAEFISALHGEGKGELKRPVGLAITTDGKLFVADAGQYKILVLDLNGHYLGEFGSYGDQPGQFKFPYGIVILKGKVYVTDPVLGRISVFDSKGLFLKSITSTQPGKVNGFAAITSDGQKLFATDVKNQQVVVMDPEGNELLRFGQQGEKPGDFSYPNGIAVKGGKIYVADSNNNRLEVFDNRGKFLQAWLGADKDANGSFSHPRGIAFDSSDHLYVVNMMGSKVMRLDKAGIVDYQWGKQGSGENEFFMPLSLAVDSTGKIYIGDNLNSRISIFTLK